MEQRRLGWYVAVFVAISHGCDSDPDISTGDAGVLPVDAGPSYTRNYTWDRGTATEWLTGRMPRWRTGGCSLNCHSALPFMISTPSHSEASSEEVEAFLADIRPRASDWENVTPWYASGVHLPEAIGTEAVLNAFVLVTNESDRENITDPTSKALDNLWEEQEMEGDWNWLDFDAQPWESVEGRRIGFAYAGLTVGMLGDAYRADAEDPAKTGIARLRTKLRTLLDESLHDQLLLLWVSARWEGLVDAEEKADILSSLSPMQRDDGGFRVGDLGLIKNAPNYPPEYSSAYATAIAILAMVSADVPASDTRLHDAASFLISRQNEKGNFADLSLYLSRPEDSLNFELFSNAATSFSMLALDALNQHLQPL